VTSTDDVIRQLYEAPPEGFVAARASAVASAKDAGDPAGAKRLQSLKKPTVAAWLVNLLALRRPELLADLAELAEALRHAQRTLKGDQLRELSEQRRQVVSALVAAARSLAIDQDPRLRTLKLPLAEVEATLTAALAEQEIADQVRSGRLVKAVSYAGFGEVPKPRLRLVTDAYPELSPEEGVSGAPGSPGAPGGAGENERSVSLGGLRENERSFSSGRDGSASSSSEGDGSVASSSGRDGSASASRDPAGIGRDRAGSGRDEAAARERERVAQAERDRVAREAWTSRRRALKRELGDAERAEKAAETALQRAKTDESDVGHSIDDLERRIAELEQERAEAQAELSRRKLARRTAERAASVARRHTGDIAAALEDHEAEEPG
jgi:hypothetical protein